MRLLTTLLSFIFSLVVYGQHSMTRGPFSSWSLCQNQSGQGLQTQFPPESVALFRERNAANSQGELAARYMAGQSLQSCSFSNNRFRALDRAQTLVTTDLMSRVQELTLAAQERSLAKIRELQSCATTQAIDTPRCRTIRDQDLKQLNERLSEMRIARAISMVSGTGGCGNGVFQNLNSERQGQSIMQCLAKTDISHDTPFVSRVFGGQRPVQMGGLDPDERQKVVRFFMTAAPEIRRNPNGIQSIREQANRDYQRLLSDYPILNFVGSSSIDLTNESTRMGLATLEQNAVRERESIRSPRFMSEGIFAEPALAQALSEIPEHQRGNYCEIANRLKAEIGRRSNTRTALLVGLGLATMGGGAGIAALGGLAAEGLGMAAAMQDYNRALMSCQSSATDRGGNCNVERLANARDNLPTPTSGALFLAGGAVDFLGALRRVSRARDAVGESISGPARSVNSQADRGVDEVASAPASAASAQTVRGQTSTLGQQNAAGSAPPALREPQSNMRQRIEETLAFDSWNVMKVREGALTNREPIQTSGGVSIRRAEVGEIGGQRVFIKTTGDLADNPLTSATENEALWTRIMDDLGVGPRFHGVTSTQIDGRQHTAIVTEFVQGQTLQLQRASEYRGPNSRAVEDQIREIGRRLDANGIQNYDLQFHVTTEGRVYVIDPSASSAVEAGQRTTQASEMAERYIQFLRQARGETR